MGIKRQVLLKNFTTTTTTTTLFCGIAMSFNILRDLLENAYSRS